jgi:hypothetical protein
VHVFVVVLVVLKYRKAGAHTFEQNIHHDTKALPEPRKGFFVENI